MKCQEFCETYFRVSRNGQQNSEIREQSIAEVMN
jgi:hypothetical protein